MYYYSAALFRTFAQFLALLALGFTPTPSHANCIPRYEEQVRSTGYFSRERRDFQLLLDTLLNVSLNSSPISRSESLAQVRGALYSAGLPKNLLLQDAELEFFLTTLNASRAFCPSDSSRPYGSAEIVQNLEKLVDQVEPLASDRLLELDHKMRAASSTSPAQFNEKREALFRELVECPTFACAEELLKASLRLEDDFLDYYSRFTFDVWPLLNDLRRFSGILSRNNRQRPSDQISQSIDALKFFPGSRQLRLQAWHALETLAQKEEKQAEFEALWRQYGEFESPTTLLAQLAADRKDSRYSTSAGINDNLLPLYIKERELTREGFIVAYHTMPDTGINGALVLYEVHAQIAEILYGIKVDMLPRLRKIPFDHWPSLAALREDLKKSDDHNPYWRQVGIACNPSLASESEAAPSQHFRIGYAGTAAKPRGELLIEALLQELQFSGFSARTLSKKLFEYGEKVFKGMDGSLLQVAVHRDYAPDYLFLSLKFGRALSEEEDLIKLYRENQLTPTMQSRVVMDPRIFLDAKKGRIFHFPYRPELYARHKAVFRKFVDEQLRPKLESCMATANCRESLKQNLLKKDLR